MGVTWTGLEAYERELEALPSDLAADSEPAILELAEAAAAAMRAAYPKVTGHLAASVVVRAKRAGDVRSVVYLSNTADYALAFEYGGAGQAAGKVFVPIARSYRRQVDRAVGGVIEGHGGTVTYE